MTLLKPIAAAASIAVATFAYAGSAQANPNDAIIAGTAGFAAGALLGNATASPRYVPPPSYGYYDQPSVYYDRDPVYIERAPRRVYVEPEPRALYVEPRRRTVVTYGSPEPGTSEWYSYCASKYRSFDPDSGTFLGYDGLRHMCR